MIKSTELFYIVILLVVQFSCKYFMFSIYIALYNSNIYLSVPDWMLKAVFPSRHFFAKC